MNIRIPVIVLPVFLFAQSALGSTPLQSEEQEIIAKPEGRFGHVLRDDISVGENLLTLSFVYAVQWGYYLIFQWETIQEHGSFENWYTNMYQPHFDKDSYNYNLILHTLTGGYYYLFYRSRGHTKVGSLMWGVLSQVLFEFTIETITEKPSFQDLFQTPVLGAVLGMTMEHLSVLLLRTDCWFTKGLGYLLNPFAIFPFSSYEVVAVPEISDDGAGVRMGVRF